MWFKKLMTVDIFCAISASVFDISTDRLPKCISMRLHSFVSKPEGPWEQGVVMAAFLIFCAFIWSNVNEWKGIASSERDVV